MPSSASVSIAGSLFSLGITLLLAPLTLPFRLAYFGINLALWPLPFTARYALATLFARRNVEYMKKVVAIATGPLYLFVFAGIAAGVCAGVLVALSSRITQAVLGVREGTRKVAITQKSEQEITVTPRRTRTPPKTTGTPRSKIPRGPASPASSSRASLAYEELHSRTPPPDLAILTRKAQIQVFAGGVSSANARRRIARASASTIFEEEGGD
ncbi:uncharacterized protein V1518DRAFT_417253 [Limtongia smithiae]|uniref:uncharacterized protein n=1 Tax=Limtongia smithiae TaxID=1125753 RepID=UPI0034CDA45E